ncbi:MAG: carboxymuconolactone decarboxylase family protein [Rhodothalassiaceae bacterium]
MSFLPSLPDQSHLIMHVWKTHTKGLKELLAYIDVVMRGPSELSIAERELISAYVSTLNHCGFCYNAHAAAAEGYGATKEMTDACGQSELPPVDDRLHPVFVYAAKLTREPHSVTQDDVDAILAQGFSEETVHDIASVVGLFNHMTRIVSGLGVSPNKEQFDDMRAKAREVPIEDRLAKGQSQQGRPEYVGFLQMLGLAA